MPFTLDLLVYIILIVVVLVVANFFGVHWSLVVLVIIVLIVLFELAVFIIDKTVK